MSNSGSKGLRNISLVLLGVVCGFLLLGAARFLGQSVEHAVHYHANWAVFLDGSRLDLTGDRYMEDIAQCSADPSHQRPEDRVHMHEKNHEVVHVHASGVTWGHLLANLRFGIGDDYLITDEGARYLTDEERTLKFIVNGVAVRSIVNRPIGDQDRLLISYGSESEEDVVSSQFAQVAATAATYNVAPDPASCSGQHETGVGERLRQAFWF
jgi:hypothetical protein